MAKKSVKNPINPTRKGVVGCILALLMASILWIVLLYYTLNLSHMFDSIYDLLGAKNPVGEIGVSERITGIDSTISQLASSFEAAYKNYYEQCQTKADLSARVNYSKVSELGDAAIRKSGTGGIIKVEDGIITIPEGMRTGIRSCNDKITGAKGTFIYNTVTMSGDRKDVLAYSHIRGPYYYVEIFNGEELLNYVRDYVNYIDIIRSVEYAYNVELYLICPDREKSRFFFNYGGNLIYAPYMITAQGFVWENSEDYGIPSDYEKLKEYSTVSQITDMLGKEQREFTDRTVLKIEELECLLLITSAQRNILVQTVTQTVFGVGLTLIVSIIFIVWVSAAYKELTRGLMTREKKDKYSPASMRLVAVCYCILGALVVFGGSLFIRSLSSIYVESDNMKNTLLVMSEEIDRREGYREKIEEVRRKLYIDYAARASELLEKNPEIRSREELEDLSRIVGAEYIMLFDSDGKQTATSSNYINMELGREDDKHPSSTADFRRLLKGVPGIWHSAYKDEVTGRKLELYGTRMKEPQTGLYGALILAVEPETVSEAEKRNETAKTMLALTPVGKVSFTLLPGDEEFSNASSEDLYYAYSPADLNFTKSFYRDGLIDYVKIEGIKYLIVSKKARGQDVLYYMCSPTSMVYGDAYRYGLYCMAGFVILFVLLCIYLLGGYNSKTLENLEKAGAEKKEEESGKKESGRIPRISLGDMPDWVDGRASKVGRLKSVFYHVAGNMSPERKALLAFQVILAFVIIRTIVRTSARTVNHADVMAYIVSGKWNRGVNLFSITSIVMLFCSLELAVMFVGFVFSVVGKLVGSRGKTICRLLTNLFGYFAVMIFFYYALSYLGVDTNAILASVGVIGIGISMGARDLIADIFAGVSMIFEGEYQVGDIVNIDGYRGMVEEIGVRSTRLIGRGGNIKVIGNKDIKSLTNLTKMNSWVAVTIKVDVTYPLRDAEEILAEALPRIGESCEYIISGPYYKGVLSVEMGFAVLSIIAECKEDDYHKVERTLIREVLVALREKNVPVR